MNDGTPQHGTAPTPVHVERPIVVALSEHGGSAALAMARALAARSAGSLVVVSVVEPPSPFDLGTRRELLFPWVAGKQIQRRRDVITDRLLQGDAKQRPTELRSVMVTAGEVATEIARIACEEDARLIVMGLGSHAGRLLPGRVGTAYETARQGSCPVLAVAEGCERPPHRVVAGTDFSAESTYALDACLSLVADRAAVHLVHAWWNMKGAAPDTEVEAHNAAYRASLPEKFHRVRWALAPHNMVRFDTAAREGNVAETLLAVSREVHADLIVVASHGYGRVKRMILGSTSAALLKHAECSVLVVPPPPSDEIERLQDYLGGTATAMPRK